MSYRVLVPSARVHVTSNGMNPQKHGGLFLIDPNLTPLGSFWIWDFLDRCPAG